MSEVTLKDIRKSFDGLEIIKGVNLEIETGEFVVFVGPSGCGKSTLLRLISGLEDIGSGSITIAGRDVTRVPPSQRGVSMVFQSYALFPHMSVAQNMSFGLRLAKVPKKEIERKVAEAAEVLQITHLLDRKPKQLSGGQRQRVAIGRSIIRNPNVFLFDEPLSNLDAALRVQMRVEISRLHQEIKTTMIYVTHDQVEAMTLADKIVVLNEGRIEQVGTPMELYRRPANRFVAEFIGTPKMNLFDTELVVPQGGSALVSFGSALIPVDDRVAHLQPGASLSLGLRPENLELGSAADPTTAEARIELVEKLGGESMLHAHFPGSKDLFVVNVAGEAAVRPGETVHIKPDPDACYLFDGNGRAIGQS
ncbi:MAG: sn-glycerol-3-phosphate ABC transporter ATP-binding protein UgpC [Rhizobiaceae bacterium]|nr:sn-glycerol-3-phosphate ABC transporter ATP-binding protein UgpC [Rhizobiaceae bacterium]